MTDPANRENLSSVLAHFPGTCCSLFGFETNLGDRGKSLDTAFCVEPGFAAFFGSYLVKTASGRRLLENHFWKKIEAFVRRWISGDARYEKIVEHIWLEFDEEQGLRAIPVPLFFFRIRRRIRRYEPVIGMIKSLCGEDASTLLIENFNKCVRAMPSGMKLKYVGVLSPRRAGALRLCFSDFRGRDLAVFLDGIGLSGCSGYEAGHAIAIRGMTDRIELLHVDICDTIIPGAGIEYRFDDELHPRIIEKWERLFSYMVDNGLAVPEKCRALLNWNGTSREILDRNLSDCVTSRYLHYVKAVTRPGAPMELKCYFMVRNCKLSR